MSRKFIFSFLFALSVSAAADARVVFLPQAAESIGGGSSQEKTPAQKCKQAGYTEDVCPSGTEGTTCPDDNRYLKCTPKTSH